MSIVFDENLDLFCLETANTSYIIGLADHRTFVGHVYYGDRLFLMHWNRSRGNGIE